MKRDDDYRAEEEEEISDEDLEAGKAFLKRFSHIIFGEGIFHRTSHDERVQFAEEYARAPNLDMDEVEEILRYSAWSDRERVKAGEDALLGKYAKIFRSTVLRERCARVKNGISLSTLFDDKVIDCVGYALNEGVTEMSSSRMMKRMAADDKSGLSDDMRRMILSAEKLQLDDGAYYLAVKAAEHLEAVVGERILMRAYFGGLDDLEILAEKVDEHFGDGGFIRILLLSDKGKWREVFRILRFGCNIEREEV